MEARGAFSVVGTLLLAFVVTTGCLGGGGSAWVPEIGDFVEYMIAYDGAEGGTTTSTIIEVTDTTITVNRSRVSGIGSPTYDQYSIGREYTFAEIEIDLSGQQTGTTLTKIGTESVDTKWGPIACERWQWGSTIFQGSNDAWVRSGIVVKAVVASPVVTATWVLTDTNIPEIINAQ